MANRAKMRSVDASRFSMVSRGNVPRSAFDLSHTHKTTFDAGYLIPVLVHEVLPGDSMRVSMTALARLATPIVPVMDNLHLESFFFFVPNRLVWSNWERFMGEQVNPTDTTQFLVPNVDVVIGDSGVGTLSDYFGITFNGSVSAYGVNALPYRAYNAIWNDFFRDQDLQNLVTVPTGDGPDTLVGSYALLRRGKRHDYFTTCRPWPQKPSNVGDSGSFNGIGPFIPGYSYSYPDAGAPVSGIGVVSAAPTAGGARATTGNRTVTFTNEYTDASAAISLQAQDAGNFPNVRVLVNDMRTASAIQQLMELNARGGTRYAEILRWHFGVTPLDARLQRPEYLGGGRSMVNVSPIAQTSATGIAGTTTVLGEQAGIGTALAHGHGFSQSFTEHGFVLGLVNIRADITYQQGVNRMWFRRGRYDYYWPSLAHLGEQAVFQKEIYAGDAFAQDNIVFGYQERWAEYRHLPNRISGGFRSTVAAPLDVWHFAQEFSGAPVLNAAFIVEDPPVERVLQVDTQEGFQFLFDSVFDIRLVRAMPMFSIPGMGPRVL